MENPTREAALQLVARKDRMEHELRELMEVLSKNNTDMNEPLVDREGYPRSDVDVYQVRLVRHQIICLRNDLKEITKRIEEALHALHAEAREGLGVSEIKPLTDEPDEADQPFAKIGSVISGSPADKAGLRSNDLILRFGTVKSSNFTGLQDVAQVVQHRENCEIPLYVRRSEKIVPVTLVPKTWSGRGLLGCTLLPFDNVDR